MTPLTVLATGPSATADEFEPLRAAGLDLVIGRPQDAVARAVEGRWIAGAALPALAGGEIHAHVINPDAIARWRARRG